MGDVATEKPVLTARGTHDDWQPNIIAFLCNWCSYAGADLAGVSRLQYGPNVRIIRVPCSARIDPQFILKALQNGADGVLVSGCHPGDCHYIHGNLVARRKFAVIKKFLAGFGNLQCIGRNGMFKYNNMDHSILSGQLAVENLFGGKHDLWQVNTEEEYHEEKHEG